ncbi:MAG TPA: hypothetical protein VIK14_13265 [Ignavibacteria bacterium]
MIDLGISELISKEGRNYLIITKNEKGEIYRLVSRAELIVNSIFGVFPEHKSTVESCKSFISYFEWCKINKTYPNNIYRVFNIMITSIDAVYSPKYCRSYFFNELGLLKLGGIIEQFPYSFEDRKLQFVDLDYLNLSGDNFGSSEKSIEFSTARFWKINNAEMHFFKFLETNLEGTEIINSELDLFQFINCSGYDVKIANSILKRCVFGKGSFIPYFDNVDLRNSDITKDYLKDCNTSSHKPSSELMKRMKNVFISKGQQSKAGKFYYNERRLIEREILTKTKHHFKNTFRFPESKNVKNKLLKFELPFYHFKSFMKNLYDYISSKVQFLYWGYGEKPFKIIIVTIFQLIIGGFLLYLFNLDKPYNLGDYIYFSTVSFLTLTDPFFKFDGITRIIVAILALLGIMNLGLLISGFTNKSRY